MVAVGDGVPFEVNGYLNFLLMTVLIDDKIIIVSVSHWRCHYSPLLLPALLFYNWHQPLSAQGRASNTCPRRHGHTRILVASRLTLPRREDGLNLLRWFFLVTSLQVVAGRIGKPPLPPLRNLSQNIFNANLRASVFVRFDFGTSDVVVSWIEAAIFLSMVR